MSTPLEPFSDQALAELMEAYLLGTLTDEQIDTFETGLLRHPKAAELSAEVIDTVAMTREIFRDDQAQRAVLKQDVTLQGFHGLLAELGKAEDRAETQLVHLVGQVKTRQPLWQQWQFVIPTAIAALLAIAVILIVTVPTSTSTPSSPSIAQTPDQSNTPTTQHVATLTATQNAVWSGGGPTSAGLSVGDTLRAGTRLTLSAGFAEITTLSGAVAILEAPAAIELLDNNNALHLHTGKLVGICETESSKGFLVRTPHLDVTDLGTRFGVDASSQDITTVHVYQGEVELSRLSNDPGAEPTALRLIQGQAASATDTGAYQRKEADAARFATIKPIVTRLPGSGASIERGQEDARWTIVAVDGQPLASPHVLRVSTWHDRFTDLQLDASIAQWLAWDPGHTPNEQGYKTYRFQTTLDLPESFDPRTGTLVLDYFADSRVAAILLNGQRVIDAPGVKSDHIGVKNTNGTRRIILNQGLLPGPNLIQIDVKNHRGKSNSPPKAVGLIAAWQVHEQASVWNR